MSEEHLDRALVERFDGLDAARREPLLRHASRCARCRLLLAADDPTRLFSLLATEPVPDLLLDRLSARIDREIEREAGAGHRRRLRWTWASAAASLLLGGLIAAYLVTRPPVRPGPEPVQLLPAVAPDVVERAEEPPVGGIRVLSSPGEAQVLDLSVGETQVVMIFDKELEI